MELKFKDWVQVTKLAAVENALFRTADAGEWIDGKHNPGMTLPVQYTNEGIIWQPPQQDKNFRMFRTKRGNIDADGYFQTSKVLKIEDKEYGCNIHTENSIYKIELLDRQEVD